MDNITKNVQSVIFVYLTCYNFDMDKKSRILIFLFLGSILVSSMVSFYRYLIVKDFVIINSTK